MTPANDAADDILIRPARRDDLSEIIELDQVNTGIAKPRYWEDAFAHFSSGAGRHFIVAEVGEAGSAAFAGFIAGEVRIWEFGSPPCGWILTIGVRPDLRVRGIGTRLFDEICNRFRADGVKLVRTMLARDDRLNMSFFRSQGLMAGSFIELEKPIV